MTRIADALKRLEASLSKVRDADSEAYAAMLNSISIHLRETLGPREREFALWVFYLSAEEDDIDHLVNVEHRRELRRSPPVDVDPELWERVVSEHWPR